MGFEPIAPALALQCISFHLYVRRSHNIHMFHSFHGYDEFNKLTCSQHMGLYSSVGGPPTNAEAMGSNPVEAPKTFFGLNCD